MKILFAADDQPYSAYALKEVTRLARNTWADVTFLGVAPSLPAREGEAAPVAADHPLAGTLHGYREIFLKDAEAEGAPYALKNWQFEWIPLKGGLWEEMLVCRGVKKDLKVRLRTGAAAPEILAEAREEESDLIVLGCAQGEQCLWAGGAPVPPNPVPAPPPVIHTIVAGGMPGWQITLIALAAALVAATVAVLLDRARAARRIHAATT